MKNAFKNAQEIIDWLNDWWRQKCAKKDQEMLSRFMKENESGQLSDEVNTWWMNRY